MSRLTSTLVEDTRMLLRVIPVSHQEHISRGGYDHWPSPLLARFTYKVSVAPLLTLFRFGPWLSVTLFHTTHRQVLQIHRLRPTLVYTNMEMSLKSVPLVWNNFWQTTERNVCATSIFSVRFYCSVCAFGCYAMQFHMWLSASWRYMKPEGISNHGVITRRP